MMPGALDQHQPMQYGSLDPLQELLKLLQGFGFQSSFGGATQPGAGGSAGGGIFGGGAGFGVGGSPTSGPGGGGGVVPSGGS